MEILQDKANLKLDYHSAVKMDDFFVVPPYQRDTSKFQDMCINVLEDLDLLLFKDLVIQPSKI
jgi:hypothetical protein